MLGEREEGREGWGGAHARHCLDEVMFSGILRLGRVIVTVVTFDTSCSTHWPPLRLAAPHSCRLYDLLLHTVAASTTCCCGQLERKRTGSMFNQYELNRVKGQFLAQRVCITPLGNTKIPKVKLRK
jgi:hypothetical protein